MSEPIKVGDLVVIVRECCPVDSVLGHVHYVLALETGSFCDECGADDNEPSAVLEEYEDDFNFAVPLSYLKRIPPLEKLEGLESEEADKLPTQRMIEAAERYKRLVTSK